MAIAIYFANPVGSVRVLLTVAGGAIIYFITLFLMRAFAKQELAFFYTVFKRNNFSENI